MNSAEPLIAKLRENIAAWCWARTRSSGCRSWPSWPANISSWKTFPAWARRWWARPSPAAWPSEFRRIQFTPDLLPGDITGSSVYNAESRQFAFSPGPIFANIVLADEINRATPRTQSALLEAMSERQVSVDGQTHPLPRPFMVIATQNPVEFEGTYPLPESQLDRFLLRIPMGYPSREVELQVLTSHREGEPVDSLQAGARWPAGGGTSGGGAPRRGRCDVERLPAGHRPGDADVRGTARGSKHAGGPGPVPRGPSGGLDRGARTTSCPTTSRTWPCPCWPIA